VLYRHRRPRPPLDTAVELIWFYRNDPRPLALERILPSGTAQLIVNLKEDEIRAYDPDDGRRCGTVAGTVLAGVRSRYAVIDTSEQEYVAGVAFRPGGTAAFRGLPAHETAEADVPLDLLWGRARTAGLRDRLLESRSPDGILDAIEEAMLEMWTPTSVHPAVAFALSAFDRAPHVGSIAAVTSAVGLSAKRFIERFRMQVGMTPKRYCRIRRFQRAIAVAHGGTHVDWTRVALDCGYFDQAHFIHDFRSFSGLTPTGYAAARTAFHNHVKFLQADAAGL